jgi:membrane protein implicated in regulation of membrane protease activity
MDMSWYHWIVLGLILGVLELMITSFYVIWFGIGALLVGLAMLILPMDFTSQVVLWTLASIGMTVVWVKVFKQSDKTHAGQADAALGEFGVMVRAVEPMGRGEVRFQKPVMGSDTWPCVSDEAIAAGQRVKVVAVDGQLLRVNKS